MATQQQHSAIVKAAKLAGITDTEQLVAFALGFQNGVAQQEVKDAKTAASARSASVRISDTDSPVIVQMQDILKHAKGCLSLAQGAIIRTQFTHG